MFFTFLLCLFSTFALAQQQPEKSDFWKHVRFGGQIGISAGDGFFSATLAPSGIYEFNNQFALGVGLTGSINNRKNIYKSTILGTSLISLYSPINEVQLSAEFEELHVSRNFENSAISDDKYWVPSLFVGAGYRTNNITFGVRYDLLYDEDKSVYSNAWAPFIRIYF